MANRSSGTGVAKPLAIAFAGTPRSSTSPSPRSSATARTSCIALFIDGMPPWWSPSFLRSFMSLKKPMRSPPVDQRLAGVVGVVLDGDRRALGQALELRREHRLADGRLVGRAPRRRDRHVEVDLLAASHVGRPRGTDRVHLAGGLDALGVEL